MPLVNETSHRGIPVFWTEVDGPMTGTLMFGVGMRDEPPHLAGITHLTEHLMFRSLGAVVPVHDGITTHSHVEFHATGTTEEVVAFLNGLGAVVRAPAFSEADLLREKLVIESENPAGLTPFRGLLTMRYGYTGIGKADAGDPTLPSITIGEILPWMKTWFTSSNARLVFTGPPPADLDLSLPDGAAPAHPRDSPLWTRPMLIENDEGTTALSFLSPAPHAPFIRDAVEEELRAVLRTDRALLYDIDTKTTPITADVDQIDVELDSSLDHPAQALGLAIRTLQHAIENGFRRTSIDSAVSTCRTAMAYPSAWASHADDRAVASLLDRRALSPTDYLELAERIDTATLSALLAQAWDTLIATCEDDEDEMTTIAQEHSLDKESFTYWGAPHNAWPTRGASWRGRGDLSFRDRAILVDDVLWVKAFDTTGRVTLSEAVVVGEHSDGSLTLLDAEGRFSLLDPADWWRGRSLRDAVLEIVPAHVRRDFSWHGGDRPSVPVDADLT
jgi:hypothetical protein